MKIQKNQSKSKNNKPENIKESLQRNQNSQTKNDFKFVTLVISNTSLLSDDWEEKMMKKIIEKENLPRKKFCYVNGKHRIIFIWKKSLVRPSAPTAAVLEQNPCLTKKFLFFDLEKFVYHQFDSQDSVHDYQDEWCQISRCGGEKNSADFK